MPDIARVASWNDLIDALFRDAWKSGIRRSRSSYAFRGQSDARLPLETGLARVTAPDTEAHLIRNFRKYAWDHANQGDSIWNWLALGQHHGLPTRLMDWTFSPYVALHFATSQLEWFDVDGIVWAVDFAATNRRLPPRLIEALDAEGSSVFTVEMLERIAPNLADLDALADEPFLRLPRTALARRSDREPGGALLVHVVCVGRACGLARSSTRGRPCCRRAGRTEVGDPRPA